MDVFYENTAGYREPTAAFRACNLADVLIPSLMGRNNCSEAVRDLVALLVRVGGLGLIHPSDSADAEYSESIRVSDPRKIEAQSHETPEEAEVQRLVYATRKEKDDGLKEEFEEVKGMLPDREPWTWPVKKAHPTGLQLFLSKTWILISTSGNFVMLSYSAPQ